MLHCKNSDRDLMNTVITGADSWVYGAILKSCYSNHIGGINIPEEKVKCKSATSSVVLTISFDFHGLVHHEYELQGQNTTGEYSLKVIHHLLDGVRHERPNLWGTGLGNSLMTLHLLHCACDSDILSLT